MSYRYIFGPVLSRRFKTSLGIDLSPDEKSCNFDCLYCELKAKKPKNFITNPPKVKDVIEELKKALREFPDIDTITITSNGEPTLYEELSSLVDEINKIKKDKKLLILSNASKIYQKNIRDILKKIDIVKLSLDCVSERCFKRLDRPLKGIEVKSIIEGMKEFRKEYQGDLVVEILLVRGVNNKIEEMEKLRDVLKEISPNRVDLGTIDRPPSYRVYPVSEEELFRMAEILEGLCVNVVCKGDYAVTKRDFTKSEILSLLKRRPQTKEDIERQFSEKSKTVLKELLAKGEVVLTNLAGVDFFKTS